MTALIFGINLTVLAQTNEFRRGSSEYAVITIFSNNPAAMFVITNLLAEPLPELSVPQVSDTWSPSGTFWTLKSAPVPLPFDPYPDLPVYQIATNKEYLIDDRSVDYAALDAQMQAQMEAEGITNQPISTYSIDTNGLWIQVPTNSLATPHYYNVNVMNTIQGQPYDILTKSDLLAPTWATELTVTGAVGSVTPVSVPMNGRTNLFVWARTSVAYSFYMTAEPLSQDVFDGDTVTFYVETGGNTNLTFQWTFNGSAIAGATNSSYTIHTAQVNDIGYYACIVSDGSNSLVSAAAELTTEGFSGDNLVMPIVSSRQNYTFQSGITYYIGSPIQFYGNTTIEAGAVLKFDFDNSYDSSLLVMGGLTCKTEPYNPAILTSIDDDSAGEWIPFSNGSPQTYISGVPYLDLTSATSNRVSNLRILYADWGVTTPVNNPRLDIWDCQFGACNYGIVDLVAGSSTNSLHNVLFAACEAGIGASSNSISIQGEQVTADVADFCLASSTPSRIALTNSIVWGNLLLAASVSSVNVAMNPDGTNFTYSAQGNYYLAANSPLHHAGSANISLRLQNELAAKTTYPPVAIAANTQISGQMTLGPQAQRYTNGAPDLGYYYDALDYTVASLYLPGGTLTLLPGTAIGVRNDIVTDTNGVSNWNYFGFYISQGGTVIGHGTPNKPIVLAAISLVQETPNFYLAELQLNAAFNNGYLIPGITTFGSDFEPGETVTPTLDFRFSHFYLPATSQHFGAGISSDGNWTISGSSCLNLNLQDCSVHNGLINLGQPYVDFAALPLFGSGTVTWNNTLFENVNINLDPTYNENNGVLNLDLSFEAGNNLFRGGDWFRLEPVVSPTSGNWVMENNLFDQVDLIQDTDQPLDYGFNGNWQLNEDSLRWHAYFSPFSQPGTYYPPVSTNCLQPTATLDGFTDGNGEQFLDNAPPYQHGTFGNYYLPNNTVLYGAGSTNAAGVGLYQYTTRTDNKKEGNESSGHYVNIGLHYIAATNGVPIDTDGDGIPDYVENWHGDGNYSLHTDSETDWQNAMTDGATNDIYNVIYLNTDLSGNGLVGRVKAALSLNPLDSSNPLTLNQTITGQEPEITTFEVPVNYSVLTNIGTLHLLVDGGLGGSFQECDLAQDGKSLLLWNSSFDSPGQHYVQVQLTLNGELSQSSSPDPTTLSGEGGLNSSYSSTICQFNPFYSTFDGGGATLYATTPTCPDADYTIELKTECGTHIRTITNSTSSGVISESWDLTDDNGNSVTNDVVKAYFHVTLLDPDDGTNVLTLYRNLGYGDGNFTIAYTWDNSYFAGGTMHDCVQWGVVDPLLMPVTADGGNDNNYNSDFDRYTSQNFPGDVGNPGYISSQIPDAYNLIFTNLPNPNTKNLYFNGHGSPTEIGDGKRSQVSIGIGQVSSTLRNRSGVNNVANWKHPFRFVFLDACDTANNRDWAHAFGILDSITSDELANNPSKVQAFVGWIGEPRGPDSDTEWEEITETYEVFFEAWMSGYNLENCITLASSPKPLDSQFPITLDFPLGLKYNAFSTSPASYIFSDPTGIFINNFSLKVYGYPFIKRTGYDAQ